jgi:uncharacterized membrane protein YqjE
MAARLEKEYMTHVKPQQESIGELLGELAGQSAALVRDEITLARQEMGEKVRSYKGVITLLAVGGVLVALAVSALCAAFIIWLGEYMSLWMAAGATGVGLAILAGVFLLIGKNTLSHLNLKPEKTLKTLEENKEWLKEIT